MSPTKKTDQDFHEELLKVAENMVQVFDHVWVAKKPQAAAFFWPAEAAVGTDGAHINKGIWVKLEDIPQSEWSDALRQSVRLAPPRAVMLIEPRAKDVLIVFETSFGSRSWTLPIEIHGDVRVLGPPAVVDDRDSVGLLWSPQRMRG